ncbi:MAG: SDR family oxidoreductase [Novosphingobium sp.]|nr:SDR family oxidoreductase [Novosphingobium sp.]
MTKVAAITGSAGGLGAAMAKKLAADGFTVAVIDVKDGGETVAAIETAGGKAQFFACDLTDPKAVAALGASVTATLGGADVLVNNAGRYDNHSFDELTYEHWRETMALNLDGMFLACKAFAPHMRKQGWGRIINIASNSTFLAPPGMAQYIASKSGAIGLARALASEFGPDGVTVNAVAPGPVVTDQLKLAYARDFAGGDASGFEDFMTMMAQNQSVKRYATPDDVTGLIAFLASDASSMITGQTIVCDGGWARV